jgi:single-strand DNA-binding protein
MSRGRNKAILIGNCGQDPELRYTPNGSAVVTVSIATTYAYKDQTGASHEETEWHRLKFIGRIAEVAGEYLKKGSKIYVEGRIRYVSFTGSDGKDVKFTEILVNELEFCGGTSTQRSGDNGPTRPENGPPGQNLSGSTSQGSGFDDFDDEIPF